jgi:hypothetical protein
MRSLEELEACVRDGARLQERFPSRTVVAVPKPSGYTHDGERVLDRGELDDFIDAELRRRKTTAKK